VPFKHLPEGGPTSGQRASGGSAVKSYCAGKIDHEVFTGPIAAARDFARYWFAKRAFTALKR